MEHYFAYETIIGTLYICDKDDTITRILFSKVPENTLKEETAIISKAYRQIKEYLNGNRKTFDLKLAPQGTAFQQLVWKTLQEIPYGETCSYGEIANRIGNPKASRAVGMANNHNPIPIIIPCHRVIGATGKLVGYAGGLSIKATLLELERQHSPFSHSRLI